MARLIRRPRLILLGVLLLAFVLRLIRLEDAPIWWDEGLAVWAARMPLADMAAWTAIDVHPPLYFALLHFWQQAAGEAEFAVRFLSAAFGVLTVAVLWQLGLAVTRGRAWVALAGAMFLTLSRFGIWWSQEARMYVLGGLLCTLSLLFVLLLQRRFTLARAIAYVIVTALALWTLYLLAFLLIIEGLYWLWSLRTQPDARQRWRSLLRWAALQAGVLALFIPWLVYALPRMRSWSVQTPFDAGLFARLYATLLAVGVSTNIDAWRWPVALILALVILGVLALFWRRGQSGAQTGKPAPAGNGIVLLLLTVLIPPFVVWLLTALPRGFGYSPKPEARYLLPYAPAFYLLAALALAGFHQRFKRRAPWLVPVLFCALVAIQVWSLAAYYRDRYLTDDYQSVSQTLAAHVRPGDGVLLHTDQPWPVFAYHYDKPFAGTPNAQEATPASVESFLGPLWEQHNAIWLVVNEDALRADKDRLYEGWLDEQATARREWRLGDKRVVAFARTPERAVTLADLAPGFQPSSSSPPLQGPHGRLVGWEQPLRRLRAGEPAHVAAYIAQPGSGSATLTLGDPPLAQTEAMVAPGTDVVRLPLTIVPPATAKSGWLPWRLSLGAGAETVGWVKLVGRQRQDAAAEAVSPRYPVGAVFGEPPLVKLLGYDLGQPVADQPLVLTLYWQVLDRTSTSYKVFSHVIGADGRPAAQGDDYPAHGERPTTTWQPGEVFGDTYSISLPPDPPSGRYPLRVGFYDPVTGARLPARDASGAVQPDDQIVLGEVELP